MRSLLLGILALFPITAATQEPDATLTVKPLLCIVDARAPSCEMRFVIGWQSRETGYYCVFNELEIAPLRCWSEARIGNLDDHRTVTETFSYRLSQGEDDAVLAAATVEVLRKDSDDRRRRRRTRHVWDLL